MISRRLLGATALLGLSALLAGGCAGGLGLDPRTGATATLGKVVSELEGEAQRARDASEIKRLQRAYGYYVDRKMWDAAVDLFSDDATIEIGLDGVYVGKARIRQYLYALGGGEAGLRAGELNEHMQLQPVVHVSEDGRTAKGRWRALIMGGNFRQNAYWGEGTYENEYVKENGRWKISKLHWYQTFIVPYAGGWERNEDLTGGVFVSKQLPPDRPPTERYGVWPEVSIPPFHYDTTVTPARTLSSYFNPNLDPDPSVAALQKCIAALAKRIERLHDMNAIENLISAYGYYLDKQQWDQFAALFVEDGTMEVSQRGVYVGRSGIRRGLELFGPQNIPKNYLHNHIQLQPVIHIDADGLHARVRSRALTQLGTFGRSAIWGDSVYENVFVKENGIWRYKSDHVYTTFFAPYSRGWAVAPRATPKRSAKIPPDHPPTEVYESFPDIYVPRFHYESPVEPSRPVTDCASPEKLPRSLRSTVSEIVHTVARLEDENAIENLQRAYGFYTDKAMWKEAADLFAEDGTLEVGSSGVFVGRERVLEYLTSRAPNGLQRGMLINHLQLQPVITIAPDGDTAQGRWRYLAELGEYQKYAIWGTGTYENEYVKEDGVWKIRKLHAFPRMYTSYENGWAEKAMQDPHPAGKGIRPDRPPSVEHELYPATFVPELHYPHPVTGRHVDPAPAR